MERRSSKREYHSHRHESNARRKPEHRRSTETDQRVSENSKRRPSHEDRPNESHAKLDLSGDDAYVRRWLAQTDQEARSDTSKLRSQGKETEHPARQKPQLNLRSFRQAAAELDNTQQQSKGKRRRRSSSDSSLLEPMVKPEPKLRRVDEPKLHKPERREKPIPKQQKKRKTAPSDSGSSVYLSVRQEIFEKRDRHKTRENRYEPKKKKHKSDKVDGEEKAKKKRERKGDRKKELKKAGDDLMNHFSSKSIGQERLTIRPSHGPGLFKNGRASSPVRRRGLPDLVFSEMEFLQHPSRHSVPNDISKVSSKSRENDIRRALREQDEISMFFKPTKPPFSETSPNARKESSSAYTSDEHSTYIKHGAMDGAKQRSQSIDLPAKPYLFGQPAPSSAGRFSSSRGRTLSLQRLRTMHDTASKLSANTTTGVTWSETQISPGATMALRRRTYEYRRSPTPESIRRSIENTGIFRDTGIGGIPGMTFSRIRPTPPLDDVYQKQLRDVQETLEEPDGTAHPDTFEEKLIYKGLHCQAIHPQSTSRHQTSQVENTANTREVAKVEPSHSSQGSRNGIRTTSREETVAGNRKTVVKHYDPELGWHQRQESSLLEIVTAVSSVGIATLRESKSTPTTREEVAKLARIKRPVTTLPITRVLEEPILHRGDNTDIPTQPDLESTGSSHHFISTLDVDVNQPVPLKASETSTAGEPPAQNPLGAYQNAQCGRNVQFYSSKDTTGQSPEGSELMQSQVKRQPNGVGSREPGVSIHQHTPNLKFVRLEPTSMASLPVRGPSRGSLRQPALAPLLTPVTGLEPLYFNQIQRQHVPRQPVFESNVGNDPPEELPEEHLDIVEPEAVSYLEDIEDDMLKEQGYGNHEYDEHLLDEGGEEFECVADDTVSGPHVWQQSTQEAGRRNHYETWNRPGLDLGNVYGVAGNTDYGHTFVEGYRLEEHGIVYEDQMAEEEIFMQRFWRSHRPY